MRRRSGRARSRTSALGHAEADEHAVRSVGADTALGEAADRHPAPAGLVADGVLGDVGRQHRRQVEAGVILGTGQERACVDTVGDELPDDLVAGPIDATHPPQMLVEVPALDEAVQRELAESRRLHAEQLPPGDRRVDQGFGQRHEAEPERGRQRLGERADVGDPAGSIEPMQWLERAIGVPELRVVVVLDDRGVVPVGERQQRAPPGEAHGDPARRLVRRGGVDDLHVRGDLVDDDAFAVDRDGHDAQADRFEQQPHGRVAGILHGDRVTGPQHRADDEMDGLLRARRHDDLVGVDDHATGPADPPRQHVAQRGETRRLAVAGQRSMQRGRRAPSPLVGREECPVRLSAAEVDAAGWRR